MFVKRLRRMRFGAMVIEAWLFVNHWDPDATVMPRPAASSIPVSVLLTLAKGVVQR